MDPKSTTEFSAAIIAARSQALELQPCLVEISGDMPGRTYCLTAPVYLFGRDDGCAIQVELDGVSRRHCEFVRTPSSYHVRDLESTNGTYVNGNKVSSHSLVEGDRIALGPNAVYIYRLYQTDEGAALSQISEGVTKDLVTGAMTRDHLVEWLQSQLALGQEQRFEIALFALAIQAPENPPEDLALKFYEALKATARPSVQIARLGALEFAVALPYTRDPELSAYWRPLAAEVALVGEFGAGLATSRDSAPATPEKLLREALQKLHLARYDIPNSLVR